jgi:hypothetical protein
VTCASCGARNRADAAWCTQCYAPSGAVELERPDVQPVGPQRTVREREGAVEWRCSRCGRWSPLPSTACGHCAAPRRGFGERELARAPAHDPAVLLGASLLLPGIGHLLAGRTGTGAARVVLWLLWLGGGWLLLAGQGPPAPGRVMLGGAGVLWVTTLEDVRRLAAGRGDELLGTRALGGLVAAVTGALLLSAVVSVFG